MNVLLWLVLAYFVINLLCALALHLHGLRQAHLPVRSLEVVMHFLLLGIFGIPILLFTSTEALMGFVPRPRPRLYQSVSQHL